MVYSIEHTCNQRRYLMHLVHLYGHRGTDRSREKQEMWQAIALEMELERRYHLQNSEKYSGSDPWTDRRWFNWAKVRSIFYDAYRAHVEIKRDPTTRETGRETVKAGFENPRHITKYLELLDERQHDSHATNQTLDKLDGFLKKVALEKRNASNSENNVPNAVANSHTRADFYDNTTAKNTVARPSYYATANSSSNAVQDYNYAGAYNSTTAQNNVAGSSQASYYTDSYDSTTAQSTVAGPSRYATAYSSINASQDYNYGADNRTSERSSYNTASSNDTNGSGRTPIYDVDGVFWGWV